MLANTKCVIYAFMNALYCVTDSVFHHTSTCSKNLTDAVNCQTNQKRRNTKSVYMEFLL